MPAEDLTAVLAPLCSAQHLVTGHEPAVVQLLIVALASMGCWSSSIARSIARTIEGLCNVRAQAPKLAKHMPALLVGYVRAVASAPVSIEVRSEMQPGIFAICDLLTAGRRDQRGREGEDVGKPFGLGEGAGGEAEAGLWADLWRTWAKKRYTGRG